MPIIPQNIKVLLLLLLQYFNGFFILEVSFDVDSISCSDVILVKDIFCFLWLGKHWLEIWIVILPDGVKPSQKQRVNFSACLHYLIVCMIYEVTSDQAIDAGFESESVRNFTSWVIRCIFSFSIARWRRQHKLPSWI